MTTFLFTMYILAGIVGCLRALEEYLAREEYPAPPQDIPSAEDWCYVPSDPGFPQDIGANPY